MEIYYGADYYPEHWPEERWEEDARLMQEMGLNVVRMAEFSWTKMEPRMGEFHFEWLEQAINLLAEHGIKTVLGTPTATPPAWIVEQNPEIFPVDSHGIRRGFGGRHHDCQSNITYRAHIRRFVTAMAEYFKDNKHVIGWQIDNEFGNSHGDLCMCPSCTASFQAWLKQKYGDIDTLNREWGNCFWSQDYGKFEQIPSPKLTVTGQNPSAMLDWKRFCSDLIVEFQQFQIDIIRNICPDKFITHNFMGFADKVNYFDLAKNLDFISHDQYPGLFLAQPPKQPEDFLSASLDLMRGTKGKSFWIMEQQAGITGWEFMGRSPKPGQLSMWAMHSIAHGADAVVFFRWRTCTVGTEQYWHGILPHSGNPGRRYEELKSLIHKTQPLMKALQGSIPHSEVGIVFSYDQEYAFRIQPHHPDFDYVQHLMRYYNAFYQKNIPIDFLADTGDFSKYKLLIAPLQYLMNPELEVKYKEYVKNGGNLVLTMRTGVKNMNNVCMSDCELPGGLSELTGLEVLDYDCLRNTNILVDWDGQTFTAEKWSDIINVTTADVLARYESEYYASAPAVTVNTYGHGKAYYVASEPTDEMAAYFADVLHKGLNLLSFGETPSGVEITHRKQGNHTYIFVINHNDTEQTVSIPDDWKPVFDGQGDSLSPFGVDVYKV